MAEYEFTDDENKTFTAISKNMLYSAIILVISGVVAFVLGLVEPSLFDVITGITVLAIGVSLYFPTDNFKRIVSTSGEDIKELMQAFSELDKGWMVVNIVTLVYCVTKILRIFIKF